MWSPKVPHLRQPRPGRKDRSRPRHHRRGRADALHRWRPPPRHWSAPAAL